MGVQLDCAASGGVEIKRVPVGEFFRKKTLKASGSWAPIVRAISRNATAGKDVVPG